MDNSIYIMLSRQLGLFRDMNVTANNIANVTTTGYNSEKMLFEDYLVSDGNRNKMAFSNDVSTYRDVKEGPIKLTSNPLDFALQGRGYFAVETPFGVRYTRAGNFQLDADGTLVTVEGFPVLDNANQPIQFDEDARNIVVNAAGNIVADGDEIAELGVFTFANEQKMERLAGAMYRTDQPAQAAEGSVRVVQGALEDSNVSGVMEITRMIEVSRGVAGTAKFIEVMYDLERKASTILARQSS